MSEFFSCLLLPDLEVRHSLDTNSHTDLAQWLGLPDDQEGTRRRFLRPVVPNGDMAGYEPDEDDPDNLPTWYEEQAEGYREKVAGIVALVMPIKAKRALLWAECEAQVDSLWAECEAKVALLRAECEARVDPLRAEYMTIPGAIAKPE